VPTYRWPLPVIWIAGAGVTLDPVAPGSVLLRTQARSLNINDDFVAIISFRSSDQKLQFTWHRGSFYKLSDVPRGR
jgi:hypothetical protein